MENPDIIEYEYIPLQKRSIDESTCRKWKYGVSQYQGKDVQVANYTDNQGKVVAQKLRFPNKQFCVLGDGSKMGFYGRNLWSEGGKKGANRITVCEGEIDALTVSQVTGNQWPCVSVPNGVAGAKNCFKKHSDYLERFAEVVICFDQDEVGRRAAAECAAILSPGKAKIVSDLPFKDPNECLQKGKTQELVNALWNAKEYRPDGVVRGQELLEILLEKQDSVSTPWPWVGIQMKTHGIRQGELITITSGTGIGKSSVCRELCYYLMKAGHKVGYLALEESIKRTTQGLIALEANAPLWDWAAKGLDTEAQQTELFNKMPMENLVVYDHWGSVDPSRLLSQIRYMIRGEGCTHLFLDHLSICVSALGDGDGNERRLIDNIMTKLRSLVEETNCSLILVSHLKRPDGRGHEEGATTSLAQLRGSHAISQLSDMVVGLERNQQDPAASHLTTMRVLKNRYSGDCGLCTTLEWNSDTGRLTETVLQEALQRVDAVPSQII